MVISGFTFVPHLFLWDAQVCTLDSHTVSLSSKINNGLKGIDVPLQANHRSLLHWQNLQYDNLYKNLPDINIPTNTIVT